MNIYEKLQNCRVELQKMNLKKTGENKFAGFKYYELADFLPTVNELFLKHKLSSNFSIIDDKAELVIVDLENDSRIVFTSPIADANIKGCTPVQSLGGVHTYLKRYLYMNALEIVESDMLDSKVGDMIIEEKPKPMSEQQKEFLNALSSDEKKEIIRKYGTTELTFKQASEVLKAYK